MTIAWATVENAVQSWFSTASGIAGAQVIWEGQNQGRPAAPYISIAAEVESVGQDWTNVEDNPSPSSGNEILHKARGVRRMTLRVSCFGGDAKGAASSRAILENVKAKKVLPSIHEALVIAGVGVSSMSKVTSISGVLNSTKLEPRATLDIVCYLASEVEEAGTYVSTVEATDQITVPDNVFTVDGGI